MAIAASVRPVSGPISPTVALSSSTPGFAPFTAANFATPSSVATPLTASYQGRVSGDRTGIATRTRVAVAAPTRALLLYLHGQASPVVFAITFRLAATAAELTAFSVASSAS